MKHVHLFPAFLKIAGRPCLVVGAGAIGEEKIQGLLHAEAEIRVVAPQATSAFKRGLARAGCDGNSGNFAPRIYGQRFWLWRPPRHRSCTKGSTEKRDAKEFSAMWWTIPSIAIFIMAR